MELSGEKLGKVDKNGRFILPRSMLEELETTLPPQRKGEEKPPLKLWLAPSVDPCLWILDASEYRRMQKRLRMQEFGNRELRKLQRKFSMLTHPETPDNQGRVLIPPRLRELAGITDQVLIIGTFHRIELWDPKTFERFESGDMDMDLGQPSNAWKYDLERVLLGDRQ
ncbi:MAG TPA: hypothetical protein ENK02_04260 [Planctomycetes bacterium]|nr:hypothetical protein [Planctomycetota bacterium]